MPDLRKDPDETRLRIWGRSASPKRYRDVRQRVLPATPVGSGPRSLRLSSGPCLDEWHDRRLGDSGYRGRRDADPAGAVIDGLRWARNRGVHQFSELLRVTGGVTGVTDVTVVTASAGMLTWRPGPAMRAGRYDPAGEAAYEHTVLGRPALDPIRAARQWLTHGVWEAPVIAAIFARKSTEQNGAGDRSR